MTEAFDQQNIDPASEIFISNQYRRDRRDVSKTYLSAHIEFCVDWHAGLSEEIVKIRIDKLFDAL